eukprot:1160207-Pelagomonas_calceolata.AAC.7
MFALTHHAHAYSCINCLQAVAHPLLKRAMAQAVAPTLLTCALMHQWLTCSCIKPTYTCRGTGSASEQVMLHSPTMLMAARLLLVVLSRDLPSREIAASKGECRKVVVLSHFSVCTVTALCAALNTCVCTCMLDPFKRDRHTKPLAQPSKHHLVLTVFAAPHILNKS